MHMGACSKSRPTITIYPLDIMAHLTKPAKYDIKDSNIALLGSDVRSQPEAANCGLITKDVVVGEESPRACR